MNPRALTPYLIVCVVWGSTYIAIRAGVQVVPPALMAGIRFTVAGLLLLGLARAMGQRLPTHRRDWSIHVVAGLLLLVGGNGLVVWAEQYVTAGVASIFVVTVSLWLALFDAIIPGSRARPTPVQFVGLLVGFAGTLLLVGADLESLRTADWRGPIALTLAAASWALGSIYLQRRPVQTGGTHVGSGLQQLAGGLALLLLGTVAGEWEALTFSWVGLGAIAYLIVFGSLIGYTAYVYVLRHLSATMTGTYAYANTIVAVFLGWLLLDELVTTRTILAMAIVLGAVAWVKAGARRPTPQARPLPSVGGKRIAA